MKNKELNTPELQKIEKEILKYTAQICETHGIKYYLAFGTLLGAVRHCGFIPWDDDIDLCMFREDYVRLRDVMMDITNSPYKLLYIDTNKQYSLPLPKVIDTRTELKQLHQRETAPLGVYIDIFILDNAPDNIKARERFINQSKILQRLWGAAQNKDNDSCSSVKLAIKKVLRRIIWLIGPRFFSTMIDIHAQKYRNKNTQACGCFIYSTDWGKEIVPKYYYGQGKRIMFEGEHYYAPDHTEEYLKNYYDDYLSLPPVEKRVSTHNFKAFCKDKLLP